MLLFTAFLVVVGCPLGVLIGYFILGPILFGRK